MVYDVATVAQLLNLELGPRATRIAKVLNTRTRPLPPYIVATNVAAHSVWTLAEIEQYTDPRNPEATTLVYVRGQFQ